MMWPRRPSCGGLSHLDSFTPGTNMQAWRFTILRNQFHTGYRKRRREVEDPDGQYAAKLAAAPTQDGYINLNDLGAALLQIPVEQREAVLLVAGGISYEEGGADLRRGDQHDQEPG
jgi:RNA polymerase sigma-70 factor, ECF subfamily